MYPEIEFTVSPKLSACFRRFIVKRVIITGANSFIASALIDKLLSCDVEMIYAVVRDSSKISCLPQDGRVCAVVLPMDEYGSLCECIPGGADVFFSFAWDGTRGIMRMDEQIQKANFYNTLKAVKCAVSMGCRNIILIGSQAEYGSMNDTSGGFMLAEDMPSFPKCLYGAYKLKLYRRVSEIYSLIGADVKEARLFSVYGRGDFQGSFISLLYESLSRNIDFFVREPFRLWDFLFVSDCAEALYLLASECSSGIYNVVSGDCRPLVSFALEMKQVLESSGNINFSPEAYTSPHGCCLSGAKLKKYCGFSADVAFSRGILEL